LEIQLLNGLKGPRVAHGVVVGWELYSACKSVQFPSLRKRTHPRIPLDLLIESPQKFRL
jgi:hypothetical protein